MQGKPITLIVYGPDDEVVRTLSKQRLKDEFMERAIDLATTLQDAAETKESLAAINQLLADFFGVTAEEIRNGCDFSEKITALQEIIAKAGAAMNQSGLINPT